MFPGAGGDNDNVSQEQRPDTSGVCRDHVTIPGAGHWSQVTRAQDRVTQAGLCHANTESE